MEVNIRLATSEELPILIELQTRSLEALSIDHYSRLQIAALVDDQAYSREWGNETRFVAEVQGNIVGFSALCHHQWLIAGGLC